jgi:hypothetical protein
MVTLFLLAALILLAMVSGLAGIVIEQQRDPARSPWRNPAVHDALLAVVGWAVLFAVSFAVELVGERLTLEFRHLLGALVMLPFYHAVLSGLRLVYVSARRIHARMGSTMTPYRPHPIPLLQSLAAPILFVSAMLAAVTEWFRAGGSIFFLLLASIAVLLALVRRRDRPLNTGSRSAAPPPGTA